MEMGIRDRNEGGGRVGKKNKEKGVERRVWVDLLTA